MTSANSDLTSQNGQSRRLPSLARMRQETPLSDAFRAPYAPQNAHQRRAPGTAAGDGGAVAG